MKLSKKSLYGEQIRKDIEDIFVCKSEYWMMSEYDEKVIDYWKMSHCNYIVRKIDEIELKDEVEKVNTMPSHSGVFVLSKNKRNMNNLNHALNGFHINDLHYTDVDG